MQEPTANGNSTQTTAPDNCTRQLHNPCAQCPAQVTVSLSLLQDVLSDLCPVAALFVQEDFCLEGGGEENKGRENGDKGGGAKAFRLVGQTEVIHSRRLPFWIFTRYSSPLLISH